MNKKVTNWFSSSETRRWFTHPTFLAIAALLVLIFVAAGVYSIADRAARVTHNANETNTLTEILRLSSAMRSDVSTISVLDQVAEAGIDTTTARNDLNDSLTTGRNQLTEVEASFDPSDRDAAVSAALSSFLDATDAVVGDNSASASIAEFGTAHRALTKVVDGRRTDRIALLETDATAMNRTGSTTGYVVAFIVPALALYVFEALRRIRLRSQLTEQANDGLQDHAQTSAALDATDLAMLEDHAAALVAQARLDDPRLRGHLDGIRRAAAALRTRAIARGAALTTSLGPVDVEAALTQILDEAGLNHLEFVSSLEDDIALADAKNFRFAIREVLSNALVHGAEPIRLKAYPWRDTITITISDGGPGLAAEIERAVFQADLRTMRQDVAAAGEAAGLVAVRSLIEAMGGAFEYERQDNTSSLVIRLQPSDVEHRSHNPAAATL